jgi:hypothetical protein
MSTCPAMPQSGQVDTFIRQFRLNEDRDRYCEDDPDVTFDKGRSSTSATLLATGIVHHTALVPSPDPARKIRSCRTTTLAGVDMDGALFTLKYAVQCNRGTPMRPAGAAEDLGQTIRLATPVASSIVMNTRH